VRRPHGGLVEREQVGAGGGVRGRGHGRSRDGGTEWLHDQGEKPGGIAGGFMDRPYPRSPPVAIISPMPEATSTDPAPDRVWPQHADTHEILPGRADAGLLLICDHADNRIPDGYGTLGLEASELKRHIAYDIGAAEVVRGLAGALGVPAVLSRYSRLLIDLNRGADDPTLIMRLSDGAVIPGNRHLDDAEREKRTRLFYEPYHRAIAALIDRCLATGVPPALLSLHSFTESWKGTPRPWHAGVLWDRDPRLAKPLIEALYADNDLIVGDNEPYTGRLEGDTMWQHGTGRGLAHAILEIRQDLIRDAAGQAAWVARVERLMRTLLGRPELQLAFRTPFARLPVTAPAPILRANTPDVPGAEGPQRRSRP
jgi:predicted N-formylglutamate amidohydrolase